MKLPQQLTFESMAKAFMDLTEDRYPTADKVLKLAKQLGIDQSVELQIIIFSKFRDAVRRVSKDYIYRSIQHRDEVYNAIIEALENLEDKLEEREEQALRDELEAAKRNDNRPASSKNEANAS